VPDDVALSANERAELERLRAEVADWRVQVFDRPLLRANSPSLCWRRDARISTT
jgi:hypothetical protein